MTDSCGYQQSGKGNEGQRCPFQRRRHVLIFAAQNLRIAPNLADQIFLVGFIRASGKLLKIMEFGAFLHFGEVDQTTFSSVNIRVVAAVKKVIGYQEGYYRGCRGQADIPNMQVVGLQIQRAHGEDSRIHGEERGRFRINSREEPEDAGKLGFNRFHVIHDFFRRFCVG